MFCFFRSDLVRLAATRYPCKRFSKDSAPYALCLTSSILAFSCIFHPHYRRSNSQKSAHSIIARTAATVSSLLGRQNLHCLPLPPLHGALLYVGKNTATCLSRPRRGVFASSIRCIVALLTSVAPAFNLL